MAYKASLIMSHYVNLNGRLVRYVHAKIPVDDRGFRFGDAVFETIRLIDGVCYQWELHEQRLLRGLKALRISLPEIDLPKQIKRLIKKNDHYDGFIRLSISRGVGSRGYLPIAAITPTIVIETIAPTIHEAPAAQLWLSQWQKPSAQSYPTQYKTAQGLNSTLALLEAHEHQCDEALILTAQGELCETASGNLFWVKGQTLYTPSLETGCLNGTTRDVISRISPYPIKHVHAPLSTLSQVDAVFTTNCNWGVRPVKSLSPNGLAWPTPSIITTLQDRYASDVKRYVSDHA